MTKIFTTRKRTPVPRGWSPDRYRARMRLIAVALSVAVGAGLTACGGSAPTPEAPSSASALRPVVYGRGFDSPVLVTYAPGQPQVRYVTEQTGRVIRIAANRKRSVSLDLRNAVDFGGERGLLG